MPEEAFRTEPLRLGIHIRPVLDQQDGRRQDHAGRIEDTSGGKRSREASDHESHDRVDPHRLFNDCIEIREPLQTVRVDLVIGKNFLNLRPNFLQHFRPRQNCSEGPGQCHCRRIVPGQQKRDQMVAKLFVGQRRPVLVLHGEENRQNVVAAVFIIADRLPPSRKHFRNGLIEGSQIAAHSPPLRGPHLHPRRKQRAQQRHRMAACLKQRSSLLPQPSDQPIVLRDAENGAQNYVECNLAHLLFDSDCQPRSPFPNALERRLVDGPGVSAHPLAQERRHLGTPLALVFVAVQNQEGIGSQGFGEEGVGFTRMEDVGIAFEYIFDRSRVGQKN